MTAANNDFKSAAFSTTAVPDAIDKAFAHYRAGEIDKALAIVTVNPYLETDAPYADCCFLQGLIALQKNETANAKQYFDQALKFITPGRCLNPHEVEIILLFLNNWKVKSNKKLQSLEIDEARTKISLLQKEQDYFTADEKCIEVLASCPDQEEFYRLRSDVKFGIFGQSGSAVIRQAAEYNLRIWRWLMHHKQLLTVKINEYENRIKITPDDPLIYADLVQCYMAMLPYQVNQWVNSQYLTVYESILKIYDQYHAHYNKSRMMQKNVAILDSISKVKISDRFMLKTKENTEKIIAEIKLKMKRDKTDEEARIKKELADTERAKKNALKKAKNKKLKLSKQSAKPREDSKAFIITKTVEHGVAITPSYDVSILERLPNVTREDKIFKMAVSLYRDEKVNEAMGLFVSLLDSDTVISDVYFYIGLELAKIPTANVANRVALLLNPNKHSLNLIKWVQKNADYDYANHLARGMDRVRISAPTTLTPIEQQVVMSALIGAYSSSPKKDLSRDMEEEYKKTLTQAENLNKNGMSEKVVECYYEAFCYFPGKFREYIHQKKEKFIEELYAAADSMRKESKDSALIKMLNLASNFFPLETDFFRRKALLLFEIDRDRIISVDFQHWLWLLTREKGIESTLKEWMVHAKTDATFYTRIWECIQGLICLSRTLSPRTKYIDVLINAIMPCQVFGEEHKQFMAAFHALPWPHIKYSIKHYITRYFNASVEAVFEQGSIVQYPFSAYVKKYRTAQDSKEEMPDIIPAFSQSVDQCDALIFKGLAMPKGDAKRLSYFREAIKHSARYTFLSPEEMTDVFNCLVAAVDIVVPDASLRKKVRQSLEKEISEISVNMHSTKFFHCLHRAKCYFLSGRIKAGWNDLMTWQWMLQYCGEFDRSILLIENQLKENRGKNLGSKLFLLFAHVILHQRARELAVSEDKFKLAILYLVGEKKSRKIFSDALEKLPKNSIKDVSILFIEEIKRYLNDFDFDQLNTSYLQHAQHSDFPLPEMNIQDNGPGVDQKYQELEPIEDPVKICEVDSVSPMDDFLAHLYPAPLPNSAIMQSTQKQQLFAKHFNDAKETRSFAAMKKTMSYMLNGYECQNHERESVRDCLDAVVMQLESYHQYDKISELYSIALTIWRDDVELYRAYAIVQYRLTGNLDVNLADWLVWFYLFTARYQMHDYVSSQDYLRILKFFHAASCFLKLDINPTRIEEYQKNFCTALFIFFQQLKNPKELLSCMEQLQPAMLVELKDFFRLALNSKYVDHKQEPLAQTLLEAKSVTKTSPPEQKVPSVEPEPIPAVILPPPVVKPKSKPVIKLQEKVVTIVPLKEEGKSVSQLKRAESIITRKARRAKLNANKIAERKLEKQKAEETKKIETTHAIQTIQSFILSHQAAAKALVDVKSAAVEEAKRSTSFILQQMVTALPKPSSPVLAGKTATSSLMRPLRHKQGDIIDPPKEWEGLFNFLYSLQKKACTPVIIVGGAVGEIIEHKPIFDLDLSVGGDIKRWQMLFVEAKMPLTENKALAKKGKRYFSFIYPCKIYNKEYHITLQHNPVLDEMDGIKKDVRDRDFIANTPSLKLLDDRSRLRLQIQDPTGNGLSDYYDKILRPIGKLTLTQTINNDRLRLLRYVYKLVRWNAQIPNDQEKEIRILMSDKKNDFFANIAEGSLIHWAHKVRKHKVLKGCLDELKHLGIYQCLPENVRLILDAYHWVRYWAEMVWDVSRQVPKGRFSEAQSMALVDMLPNELLPHYLQKK